MSPTDSKLRSTENGRTSLQRQYCDNPMTFDHRNLPSNQGMTMTNNETEQHKTQRLSGYEAWQARVLNRQVMKLAIFSLLGVGLLLWLAQGIGNGPPNDHLRPDAEFWGAYGTAVNGILGTVFTGVGAVFGSGTATWWPWACRAGSSSRSSPRAST